MVLFEREISNILSRCKLASPNIWKAAQSGTQINIRPQQNDRSLHDDNHSVRYPVNKSWQCVVSKCVENQVRSHLNSERAGSYSAPCRLALTFKGLPFKTEWVEYPDIENLLKKLGGAPTEVKEGRDHYTLPAIHDSNTGKVITDSLKIAEYLEDTYPDTPPLFPFGARAAVAVFDQYFLQTAAAPMRVIMLPESCYRLNPASKDHFRRTRESTYKMKLEEFSPVGPKRDADWEKIKEGYANISGILSKNGPGKPFFFGDTLSYADMITASYLLYIKIIIGADTNEWKAVEQWDDGRWVHLLEVAGNYHRETF